MYSPTRFPIPSRPFMRRIFTAIIHTSCTPQKAGYAFPETHTSARRFLWWMHKGRDPWSAFGPIAVRNWKANQRPSLQSFCFVRFVFSPRSKYCSYQCDWTAAQTTIRMNAAIHILKEGFDCYQKRTLQHSNCANETILFGFLLIIQKRWSKMVWANIPPLSAPLVRYDLAGKRAGTGTSGTLRSCLYASHLCSHE